MATEKQIMMRITATKNISKITQSMKMVSAAKLRGDQARLEKAQPFNVSQESESVRFWRSDSIDHLNQIEDAIDRYCCEALLL